MGGISDTRQLMEIVHLTLHGLEMGVVILLDPHGIGDIVVIFVEMEKERILRLGITDRQVKGLETDATIEKDGVPSLS